MAVKLTSGNAVVYIYGFAGGGANLFTLPLAKSDERGH
jgi:hypothetical protein